MRLSMREGEAAVIYIENNAHDPAFNQAFEEYVFERVAPDETILMLWRNAPAVVCGCYQNAFAEVDMLRAAERGGSVIISSLGGAISARSLPSRLARYSAASALRTMGSRSTP